jgi:hypothetical protein
MAALINCLTAKYMAALCAKNYPNQIYELVLVADQLIRLYLNGFPAKNDGSAVQKTKSANLSSDWLIGHPFNAKKKDVQK